MQKVILLTEEEYEALNKPPVFTDGYVMKLLEKIALMETNNSTLWITVHKYTNAATYKAIGDEYEQLKKKEI